MEMQNRYAEGQEFLVSRAPDWAPDNGLAFHNWWRLALFHLKQEDYAAALKLYDDEIDASESDISLELVDASALLWRITLGGRDRQPGSDGNNGASCRGIGMFRDDRIRRTML